MRDLQDLSEINPDLKPEVMDRINEVIARYRGLAGALIPVLTECQGITGYLPVELQEHIAAGLNLPRSAVYGVVTFYSFFSMVPKGRHVIKVCMGTACYVRGIKEVLNRLQDTYKLKVGQTSKDRRFSLEAVRCLGACGLAPVMVVDGNTHGAVTPEKSLKITERYE